MTVKDDCTIPGVQPDGVNPLSIYYCPRLSNYIKCATLGVSGRRGKAKGSKARLKAEEEAEWPKAIFLT